MALNDSFMQPPDYYLQAYNAQHPDAPLESFMDQNGRKGYRQVGQKQAGPTVTVPNNIPSSNIGPGNPNLTFDPSKIKSLAAASNSNSQGPSDLAQIAGVLAGVVGVGTLGKSIFDTAVGKRSPTESILTPITKAVGKVFGGSSPQPSTNGPLAQDFGNENPLENGFLASSTPAASVSNDDLSATPQDFGNSSPVTFDSGSANSGFMDSTSPAPDITGGANTPPAQDFGSDVPAQAQGDVPGVPASDSATAQPADGQLSDSSGFTGGDAVSAAGSALAAINAGTALANGDFLQASKSIPYVGPFIGVGDAIANDDYTGAIEAAAMSNPYTAAAVGAGHVSENLYNGDLSNAQGELMFGPLADRDDALGDGAYYASAGPLVDAIDDINPLPDPSDIVDSVICTELHDQGIMPDYMFEADKNYGQYLRRYDPYIIVGYHAWAKPIVKLMRKYNFVTKIMAKIALPWGEEMAYQMHGRDKGNLFGRCLIIIGMPICRLIGKMKGLE